MADCTKYEPLPAHRRVVEKQIVSSARFDNFFVNCREDKRQT